MVNVKAISTPTRSGAVMARRQIGAIAEEGGTLNCAPSADAVAGKVRHPEG
jgi:hypothetical protein